MIFKISEVQPEHTRYHCPKTPSMLQILSDLLWSIWVKQLLAHTKFKQRYIYFLNNKISCIKMYNLYPHHSWINFLRGKLKLHFASSLLPAMRSTLHEAVETKYGAMVKKGEHPNLTANGDWSRATALRSQSPTTWCGKTLIKYKEGGNNSCLHAV